MCKYNTGSTNGSKGSSVFTTPVPTAAAALSPAPPATIHFQKGLIPLLHPEAVFLLLRRTHVPFLKGSCQYLMLSALHQTSSGPERLKAAYRLRQKPLLQIRRSVCSGYNP